MVGNEEGRGVSRGGVLWHLLLIQLAISPPTGAIIQLPMGSTPLRERRRRAWPSRGAGRLDRPGCVGAHRLRRSSERRRGASPCGRSNLWRLPEDERNAAVREQSQTQAMAWDCRARANDPWEAPKGGSSTSRATTLIMAAPSRTGFARRTGDTPLVQHASPQSIGDPQGTCARSGADAPRPPRGGHRCPF